MYSQLTVENYYICQKDPLIIVHDCVSRVTVTQSGGWGSHSPWWRFPRWPERSPILDLNPNQSDEKSKVNATVETSGSPELVLSISHQVAESKDQENRSGGDLGSTPGEDLKPAVKQNKRKRHPGKAKSPADTAVDWNTDTGATQMKVPTDVTGASPVHADNLDARSACGEGSRGRRSSVHTRNRTGTGPFNFETCGEEFEQSIHLKQQARVHTGERPYSWKTCGKELRMSAHLKVHMRNSHSWETLFLLNMLFHVVFKPSELRNPHQSWFRGETLFL